MIITGLLFATLGALVHIYIFILESFLWTTRRGRAVFGTTEEQAHTTRELALNQGFYNLFLAVIVVVGVVLALEGATAPGAALVFAGAGSMVAAGVVLLVTSPDKARPALIQLTPPLLGVAAFAVGLLV